MKTFSKKYQDVKYNSKINEINNIIKIFLNKQIQI